MNVATEPECICIHRFLPNGIRHVQQAHPLCPIHGDVRDTGYSSIIELCDLCGSPLGNGDYGGVHSTCADAENAAADTGFVIDSKDDYITAIEDAIEELDDE